MDRGSTLHDLEQTGLIVFAGADAQSFLQGQLSCDVGALAPDTSTYGGYCSPKGRVLATFLLWRSGQSFFMQLPATLRETIRKRIAMYVLRAKVTVTDMSEAFVRVGVAGDGAEAALKSLFEAVPGAAHAVTQRPDVTLIRLPHERFELVVAAEKATAIRAALNEHAEGAARGVWELLDIRAGIPWITPATQEQFVPQSLNLDLIGGVSFSKGCYPGQEIVARMHYRGQVKQRMYRARIAAQPLPQPGDKLYSSDMGDMGEQSCGMIVNAAATPEGGYDALAAIQMSSVEAGDVRWKAPNGPALEFLPLPYDIR